MPKTPIFGLPRIFPLVASLSIVAAPSLAHQAGSQAIASPAWGLEDVYEPGFLLEDHNGDGHLDFVRAVFALPPQPSNAEVAAAANVAARLGFETSSMDLPLARTDGAGLRIAIGLTTLPADRAADIGSALEPGLGVVTVIDGASPSILIAGGDDAGTAAAAMALAARLPHIWDPSGATLAQIEDDVAALLEADGISTLDSTIRRIAVRADAGGLDRVDLDIIVSPTDMEAAVAALERNDPDNTDLLYPGLRLLRVAVGAAGAPSRLVWIEHDEYAQSAGGGRPGGGNKGDLDLSNLYSNDGFFSDTDSNLIPDRVDVMISMAGDRRAASADLGARLGLEAAGITLPVARAAEQITDAAGEPPLILIGAEHPLVAQLVEDETLVLPVLEDGQG